ncbi:restriction endonuclease subunit S [Serratia fonticola]|uniref:restriction endonuclease subunit S n=1 Tax=Serratia fonticola TaxID=47917 RepID=UPI00192B57E1|nr:restriction endonuclease subunit S [Serratia fonticola]MBL5906332.1 restriction endonuclease subunit S [Serratia fonticola]
MVDLMVNEQQSGTAGKGVPAGFKLTEVGVIPEGWDVKTIGQLNPFITSGSRGWADFYVDYGDLFVRITNMSRNSIYLDTKTCENRFVSLPVTSTEGKRTSLNNGDVLISITADIGIIGYIDESIAKPAYINQHISLVRFDDNSIDNKFIAYFLAGENVQKKFLANSDLGAKAGMNLNGVRSIIFAVPTKKEQSAIAKALTDVDILIVELKKFLTKKQAIKTATMQQLLTGKTRLPQFALRKGGSVKGCKKSELGEIPEDWVVNNIGNLFSTTAGGDLRQAEFSDIQSEEHPYPIYSNAISHYGLYGYCHSYDYIGDYLTITARGGVGHAVVRKGCFCAIGRLLVLSPKGDSNVKFYEEYINQYLSFANESTGVPQLTAPQVAKYLVVYPGIEEQTAIAAILSDMDKEIQTLQQRLDKTRQLKQGMMQELLTGKTRLI